MLHVEAKTLQTALAEEYARLKLKNPSYSLRAFARRLGLVPSAMSELINGKRGISRKRAEALLDRLMLDPVAKENLLCTIPFSIRRSRDPSLKTKPQTQLSVDHYHTIAEWYHFAILSLAETEGFRCKPEWIAKRLGISEAVAAQAIDRMLRLEMLEKISDKEWRTTGLSYNTSDHIANLSLRKAHHENLELAAESLNRDPVEQRDFVSTTMAIDPTLIPEAKRRIRQFHQELSAFLESGKKTEVYKVSLQMIPLTVQEKRK